MPGIQYQIIAGQFKVGIFSRVCTGFACVSSGFQGTSSPFSEERYTELTLLSDFDLEPGHAKTTPGQMLFNRDSSWNAPHFP